MIAVFYDGHLSPNGAATFTEHLVRMLIMGEQDVKVFCIRKVSMKKPRPMIPGSDIMVHRITLGEAQEVVDNNLAIIAQLANDKSRESYYRVLLKYGIPYCHHGAPKDYTDFAYATDISKVCGNTVVMFGDQAADNITEQGHENVVVMNHPYVRVYNDFDVDEVKYQAVAVGRVASEKKTDMVCEANAILPDTHKIKIYGLVTARIWEYRSLSKRFPNWKDDWLGPYATGIDLVNMCRDTIHGIDLTTTPCDGGRTQYVTLEMMDAGCNIIVNDHWLRLPGEMQDGYNCIGISTAEELAEAVLDDPIPNYDAYEELLHDHSSDVLLPQILDVIYDTSSCYVGD